MPWNKDQAMKEIEIFFEGHGTSAKAIARKGKIYELFCLVKLVAWLEREYDAKITYVAGRKGEKAIDFKASPGNIDYTRSYFKVRKEEKTLELHVDIEVETLSNAAFRNELLSQDLSGYHEIDLVLIEPPDSVEERPLDGMKPRHDHLVLGVECKATKSFDKTIVRQVLGVRRELSMLTEAKQCCKLDLLFGCDGKKPILVKAQPASLYFLFFADPNGKRYAFGPEYFGIYFCNMAVEFPEDNDN